MRTTPSSDKDTLAATMRIDELEQKGIDAVISNLTQQELSSGVWGCTAERNGIPLLPNCQAAVPVNLELINQLRDEKI